MTDERIDHAPWPMRAVILLAAGALCGLAIDLLTRTGDASGYSRAWTDSVPRLSLASFVASAGILLAFTLERARWTWSLAFALGGGAVLGGIYYWNGSPEHHSTDDIWRGLASLLAIGIAAPLFQAVRDEGKWRLPYVAVHAHSWTNVVLWCAAWLFVLISFLLAWLLAALFELIGIDLLSRLIAKSWFGWMLCGGALGAAVGLLRDRDKVLGLLQRVVTTVLSVLAPILALGLVLFVLALPFTGLGPLWEQTKATTPILLFCAIGSIILANAVIGNAPEEEARNPVLRISAMALGAVMAPLVAVAAISTKLRIDQHGLTPARLWAMVFIGIAAAYALLYLYALVRDRARWADRVRRDNIRLAVAVCVLALFLATPLAQFGAISTRSQLSRLESGRVDPAEFDWRALRFDFGASGVAALDRLRISGSAEQRRYAAEARRARFRWDLESHEIARRQRRIPHNIRYLPSEAATPAALRDAVLAGYNCTRDQHCVLIHEPGSAEAFLVSPGYCNEAPGLCEPNVSAYYRDGERWSNEPPAPADHAAARARYARFVAALREGRAEIRPVPRRQVFVDGEPVGEPFE